jgi:ubiquinone/menaquinone biosynthesis C-methylase UbiE
MFRLGWEFFTDDKMYLSAIYQERFTNTGLAKRDQVWQVLCRSFFDPLIGPDKIVLDLACGYGEFINNVRARNKIAVDLNPDARGHLNQDVQFVLSAATDLVAIPDESIDVAFTSNFLEHLPDKKACNDMFAEIKRVLNSGGRFIVLGPNIKYAYREYWDFFDHYLPLSHLSLEEGLKQAGFNVTRNIPRFLPFTMKSSVPTAAWLIELYLMIPFAWRFMGKQFLVVAEKP